MRKIKQIISLLLIMLLSVSLFSCSYFKKAQEATSLDEAENVETKTYINNYGSEAENDEAVTNDQSSELTEDESVDTEEAQQQVSTGKLAGRKICVDPGHGTFTQSVKEPIAPGSTETKAAFVTGTSGSYQTEAEFNLKVGMLLKEMLEAEGAEVFMTRTGAVAELSNVGRAQLGNDNNCDCAVRIHADASSDSSVYGLSMLVPGSGGYITDYDLISESRDLGIYVLESVIDKTGAYNRGIINRNDLTGFNWSTIPSILIECGFMTNPQDDAMLADPDYQVLIAEGITQGLINYFNK
ncbi:MAG: N-acetylmuramoyl-L-alanine amidase [Clostridia bacterium]|nr:N-acetylmuramoyl-L-alanine amidase [Clostridia bacterium]